MLDRGALLSGQLRRRREGGLDGLGSENADGTAGTIGGTQQRGLDPGQGGRRPPGVTPGGGEAEEGVPPAPERRVRP